MKKKTEQSDIEMHYHMHDYQKSSYLLERFRLFHKQTGGVNVDYHYHEFCKLLLLHSGTGYYVVDAQRYLLQPGDIVLINSNSVHRPEFDETQDYDRTIIYVDPAFLKEESGKGCDLSLCFTPEKGHVLRLQKPQYKRLRTVAGLLEEELSQPAYGREVLAKALVLELLVTVCRFQQQDDLHISPVLPKNDRILNVLRYIDDHLCEKLEIEKLADQFFVSRYHLMRLFQNETGFTIHSYLNQRRLLLAREMLKKGVSAADACYRSGFRSYSAFTRSYSKYFGSTPTGRMDPSAARSPSYE